MPTIMNTEGDRFISFSIGDDHALMYQETDDSRSWGDWKSLGGNLTQFVTATSPHVGIEVFAIDRSSGQLVRIWRGSGNWSGWNSDLGGMPLKQIAIGKSPHVGLEVFGIHATSGELLRTWEGSGNWSGWNSDLGGMPLKQIAINTSSFVGLQVFGIRTSNGSLVRISEGSGTWSGWNHDLGGVDLRKILTARQPNGCIQVFALGGNDQVYRIKENVGPPVHWGGWNRVVIDDPFNESESVSGNAGSKVKCNSLVSPKAPSVDFVPVETPGVSQEEESESSSERAKRLRKECWRERIIVGLTINSDGPLGFDLAVAALKSANAKCEEAKELDNSSAKSGDTYGNGPVRAGADTWYI